MKLITYTSMQLSYLADNGMELGIWRTEMTEKVTERGVLANITTMHRMAPLTNVKTRLGLSWQPQKVRKQVPC